MSLHNAGILYAYPLAQLVDLLPGWGWNALLVGGMAAPVAGLLISMATKTSAPWKRTAVGFFYVVSVPLAGLVFWAQSENPVSVCSFLILLPVGMILGLGVLVPHGRAAEPRGFEVQIKRDGEAG